MSSHPVGLDVWFLVGPFVYFHTLCVWTTKALVRLRGCAGSPEPSLVAYLISTISSWAVSNVLINVYNDHCALGNYTHLPQMYTTLSPVCQLVIFSCYFCHYLCQFAEAINWHLAPALATGRLHYIHTFYSVCCSIMCVRTASVFVAYTHYNIRNTINEIFIRCIVIVSKCNLPEIMPMLFDFSLAARLKCPLWKHSFVG